MSVSIAPYADAQRDGVRDLIVPIQQQEFDIPITYADQPDLQDIPGFYRKGPASSGSPRTPRAGWSAPSP